MHDDLQLGRLYQLDECFADRQIPCRWVPDMGYGYGYPLFNFYPPFPYYLAEVFHLLGASLIDSIKFVFILGFVFSGILMYFLAREFWGEIGGLVSAVFYLWAPYHAVDVYVRGALNEFWALVFFPAVFWAVYKLIKEENWRFVPVLAIFYSLLLLSHNLMSFFFTPAIVLWGVFLVWYLQNTWLALIKPLIAGIWGVGLASFFVLPMIIERKFAHIETMFIGYFNYLAHFVSLNQMFVSRFWGYGASTWGPEDGMAFAIGQLHWLMVAVSLLFFGVLWLKKRDKRFYLVTLYSLLFTLCSFLAHLRSTPIWQRITILSYMQFPWRFLGFVAFFTSFLGGAMVAEIKEKKKAAILGLVLVVAVIVLNFSYFQPEKIIKVNDAEKLFSPKGWHKLQTDAIFDYLPIYAERPPGGPAPEKPWFEEGEGEIKDFQKGTDWQEFKLDVNSEKAIVRLPQFFFPGWKVWVDGQQTEIDNGNFLGLITFEVSKGEHRVSAYLTNTKVRTLGNLLSLIAFLGLAISVVKLSHERGN